MNQRHVLSIVGWTKTLAEDDTHQAVSSFSACLSSALELKIRCVGAQPFAMGDAWVMLTGSVTSTTAA